MVGVDAQEGQGPGAAVHQAFLRTAGKDMTVESMKVMAGIESMSTR